MNARKHVVLTGICATLLSLTVHANAAVTDLFEYNFPASAASFPSNPTAVNDLSTANNDANAFNTPGLSTNVPTGAPLTDRSLSFGGASGAASVVDTVAVDLLDNTALAAAGGFTFDVWVNMNNFSNFTNGFGVIYSYAGTENLGANPDGTIGFGINGLGTVTSLALSTNTWYHVVAVFDSGTNTVSGGTLAGVAELFIDGVSQGTASGSKSAFGDSLNRPIGIGRHPTADLNRFSGLIYNPTAYLGAVVVPAPASLAGGLAMMSIGALRRRRR